MQARERLLDFGTGQSMLVKLKRASLTTTARGSFHPPEPVSDFVCEALFARDLLAANGLGQLGCMLNFDKKQKLPL